MTLTDFLNYLGTAGGISAAYGVVPCDANGDVYFTASGTVATTIEVWGYAT